MPHHSSPSGFAGNHCLWGCLHSSNRCWGREEISRLVSGNFSLSFPSVVSKGLGNFNNPFGYCLPSMVYRGAADTGQILLPSRGLQRGRRTRSGATSPPMVYRGVAVAGTDENRGLGGVDSCNGFLQRGILDLHTRAGGGGCLNLGLRFFK
ncbi:MAG: hypothetical protein K0R52_1097 [Alphaproteobacteria bacterium]|jgi:hypothetical protein|nr:hypothetical protein [Alphaproteobacteria bacterium]